MYRLLLVDDERHVIDWLFDLFREQADLDLDIYRAYTARQALAVLEQTHMDIILSDIRMPGMDGFQLADEVLSRWPACRILFLTGYDSFDYIYRANKSGCIRYLLKTEDDEEIVEEIRRSIASLEEEKRNQKLLAEGDESRNLAEYLLQRRLVLDAIAAGELREDASLPLAPARDNYLLLGLPGSGFAAASGMRRAQTARGLATLSRWYFQNDVRFVCLDWRDGCVLWIFQAAPESFYYIREMLEPFSAACLEWDDSFPLLLCGTPLPWNALSGALDWMAEEVRKSALLPDARFRVVDMPQLCGSSQDLELRMRALLKKISLLDAALECQDRGRVHEILMEAEAFLTAVQHAPLLACELVQTLTQLFLRYLNRNCLAEEVDRKHPLALLAEPKRLMSDRSLAEKLEAIAGHAFRIIEMRKLSDAERLVNKIQSYIREDLRREFTLTTLAGLVNYSPTYVSRLFRQVSGVNLFDYILSQRMERAQYLLRHTGDSVQDIAEKTGFDSSQYFSTVFKRSTGLTPLEFRRK